MSCLWQPKESTQILPKLQFSRNFKKGHGTQRIEDITASLLPSNAIISRIDADVMSKNLFRETLNDFRKGKIDILVGTQMIAKGLDFPNVTLVGVIDADLPLRIEDFRASERAFQLLTQVSGRAGRGDRSGEVYVQTYAPSHLQFNLQGKEMSKVSLKKKWKTEKNMHIHLTSTSSVIFSKGGAMKKHHFMLISGKKLWKKKALNK